MKTLALVLALSITAPLAFTACDRTVATETKTTSGENGTKTESKQVTQSPNGDVTVTKEKSTSNNP